MLQANCQQFPVGPCNADPDEQNGRARRSKRDAGNQVRDFMSAFALCNNVTPVLEDPDIDKALEVGASPPRKRATHAPTYDRSQLIDDN